jgi:crotonobetainyl-CoA:carnitine CoA-transferase CaiB-like acyl-CoA transferase
LDSDSFCYNAHLVFLDEGDAVTEQALAGIRVLDFTRVLAGPLCTMILGDIGADVIKIEHHQRGDDTREWGPPYAGNASDKQSAYFLSVNRNKRSLTLNLKTQAGRDIARQLAAKSHIVIENFKLGQMASFGLSYDDLKLLNPALVYCSITGFGQTGLYQERPGYDYVVQAMSGLMSVTGASDGEPHKVGVAVADVLAGLFAVNGILAALRHSERTGQGQFVDIALLDAQIAALVNIASNYLVSGQTPPRLGNLHPNIVPYQTFTAADGDFVLAVGNDGQFRQLCQLIQRTDLAEDERFATNPARVKNRNQLIPILQRIFLERPREAWITALLDMNIPAGPINDVAQALTDPHVIARGLIQQTRLADGSLLNFVGSPLNLSETPPQVRYAPPALGQHTDEILCEVLDMDAATIAHLHKLDVI